MKPTVYMMLGLPGSGKTTFSKSLQKELTIPRLSLDEVYSELGGDLTSTKWDMDIESEAHQLIKNHIKEFVDRGTSVILDFCPWKKCKRHSYREYIHFIGAKSHLYYFDVPIDELIRRLQERNTTPSSQAHTVTPDMLNAFTARFDPPYNEEYERVETK